MRSMFFWLLPAGAAALTWLLSSSKAEASTPGSPLAGLTTKQRAIAELVAARAHAIGVPAEFALATCELESNFADIKASNGESYGPMQVHVSTLRPGETVANLKNMTWNIARGVLILQQRLKLAGGDSELARIMYFCGPGWQKSCSATSLGRVRARWRPAAARWGVKARYPV
jgi:hypothetical protein